jgi:Mg2+ and Co2+ transporter CorA
MGGGYSIESVVKDTANICNNVKKEDAEYLVKCANEHSTLVKEVEELRNLVELMSINLNSLK